MDKNRPPQRLLPVIEKILLLSASIAVFFLFARHYNEKEKIEAPPPAEAKKEIQHEKPAENHKKPGINTFEIKDGEILFDEAIDSEIDEIVSGAKESVIAVSYTFGKGAIAETLSKAAKRGVKVSVIAQISEGGPYSFAFDQFVPPKGIMHEKFMVIDKKAVLLSSRNFTKSLSRNSAIYFKDSPRLAGILEQEFESLSQKKYFSQCPKGCDFEAGTIFITPGKACVMAKKTILGSRKEIDLAMYTLTMGTPLMTGLKNAMKKNKVKLKAVVDDWDLEGGTEINKNALNYLESIGGKIRFDRIMDGNEKVVFHHKFAVIDNRELIFGSMNWTKSGCYKNREFLVVSRRADIASIFKKYFDGIK